MEFQSFLSSKNDSEQNSEAFSPPKIVRNGIPRFFSSKNGSEWNSEDFSLLRNHLERNFKDFSLPRNGSERNSEGFSLPRNGSEQSSEGFSLSRNGSERNSEVFLFRKTEGILTELPSVLSCSVFRRIIFLLENSNPGHRSALNFHRKLHHALYVLRKLN